MPARTGPRSSLHGLAVLSLRQPDQRFGMGERAEDLAAGTLSAISGL
ncbi:hypothetical protein AB4039_01620 [Streptomyces sp. M-16]